jgi:AraC-like DNA-binding protein
MTVNSSRRHTSDEAYGKSAYGRGGTGELLALLRQIASEPSSGRRTEDDARLGTILVDLTAALRARTIRAAGPVPHGTHRRTLALGIRAYIDRHLGDPELTPASIAAAHHISLRSLHRLFQDDETTVAGFIRHRRLERVRRDLTDPELLSRPIHAVAARC